MNARLTSLVVYPFKGAAGIAVDCDGRDERLLLQRDLAIDFIVFTGGDPLLRRDIVPLVRHAHDSGLEVAVSTTGDRLTREFLDATRGCVALISLPLDGSDETRNARTKHSGHFAAVMAALDLLRDYPEIDVKVCTPVTRDGVDDVVNIAALTQAWADTTLNRVFYNVFQVFPRSWEPCHWDGLIVSDAAWEAMVREVEARRFRIRINFLSTQVLDQLYVLILPDGGLYVPSGPTYHYFGQALEIDNLDAILSASTFDSIKHLAHSKAWAHAETIAPRRS